MILQELTVLLMNLKTSIIMILALIIAFLAPIIPLIMIVGILIVCDTIGGITRARKLKEKVTSRKLSKLISKMVLYQTALITFFLIEKYIIGDFILLFTSISLFLTKLVALTLSYVEIKSIGENLEIITGKNYWTLFKELLSRGKEIKNQIEDVSEKTEKRTENRVIDAGHTDESNI